MKGLWLSLLTTSLLNCGNQEPVKKREPERLGYAHIPQVRVGWDIYLAGIYRYGPSIIGNDDGSIDAWFAAEGDRFGEKIENYIKENDHVAVPLQAGQTAAQRFSAGEAFFGLLVNCPSWGSKTSSLTLSLYRWVDNYAATLKSQPVSSKRFVGYEDNKGLILSDEERFSAGTYLWVLTDANGTAGVWRKSGTAPNVLNYLNGATTTGSYECDILPERTQGGLYWDQAAYRRSTDGGKTWTKDQMVLKPTEGSRDQLSVCDPGTVRFGGYYYLGYTSTEDERGLFNHVYLARSRNPNGPWEKWNGSGWGGNPLPLVTFDGHRDAWGAGEPSMVVVDNRVYFYYSWNDLNGTETTTTRVATADATDDLWPGKLQFHGTAMNKSGMSGADHCDVKYRKDLRKFQAIHTASRLTASSYIVLWESTDGTHFEKAAELRGNLKPFLHNCGWSGDALGQIDPNLPQFISYAYGPDWAAWNTAWHPLNFK